MSAGLQEAPPGGGEAGVEPGRASGRGLGPEVAGLAHISKRFGSTRAVDDLSLQFHAGEVHAVLGQNGAGKSTVAKILGGLVQPDLGVLRIEGRAVRLRGVAEARRLGVAMVYQELSIVADLTVRENIHLGTEAARHPFSRLRPAAERAQCRSLLEVHRLDLDLDQRVGDLAVASQQLIEVLKALARRPRLLILDEPTAMLGVREKDKLLAIIGRARAEGVAVVFVTHHVDEVVAVADRVSLMKDGALVDSFAMTEAHDAACIVEKLAGRLPIRDAAARVRARQREVLVIRNLAGRDGQKVDVTVRSGEVVGLYGVVGAGCEAIGHAVVGLAHADAHAMTLNGDMHSPRDPAAAARAGVSYLPSGRAAMCVLPSRSIRENLMISQLSRVSRCGAIRLRAEWARTQSLLADFRTRFADCDAAITTLSGGNQQKVLLARCLGRASTLIVLEDPTAGVDIAAKRDIHELIRDRADAGASILLVSSDLRETIALCDVIYTVNAARIVGRYVEPQLADESRIVADVVGG